jgi:hypothetical protein
MRDGSSAFIAAVAIHGNKSMGASLRFSGGIQLFNPQSERQMKSKRTVIPSKTARTTVHIVPRREPRHPSVGRLPMSLARALTEPIVQVDQVVEEGESERMVDVRRRKAA